MAEIDNCKFSETVRKLDAIQESTTLVVLFTELFSKGIATWHNALQRSIITEQLLKFFDKKFTLVFRIGPVKLVATDYNTLFALLTTISTDIIAAYGLIGSLATTEYEDNKSECRCGKCHHRRERTVALRGTEFLTVTIVFSPSPATQDFQVVLKNQYKTVETRKHGFKFSHVEIHDVHASAFAFDPFPVASPVSPVSPSTLTSKSILIKNEPGLDKEDK